MSINGSVGIFILFLNKEKGWSFHFMEHLRNTTSELKAISVFDFHSSFSSPDFTVIN